MLISFKKNEWFGNIKNDILGGMVTSIALIPEVIGFAIIAGVNPIAALFASVTTAIVTTITGGRPGMVSAAAGSMALVMVSLIKSHGLDYMIMATVLTGVIQLLMGYLGVHKLMKFISKPVMLGFVNALAILIFLAQIQQLGSKNLATYIMVGITILLMYILPKISKAIPPALIVIIAMTFIAFMPQLGLQTVGDLGDMSGTISLPSIPEIPLNFETLLIILPTSLALSMVGLIESLLTLPIVDELTDSIGDSKREVKSQGLANIITGMFGGQAGCAMIGQAVINIKSGGRKRLSTLTAAVSLLFLIIFLKDVMIKIPTAALIGIMITVAFETFNWSSIKYIRKTPVSEIIIMCITISIVVYTHNLAIGILIGVVLSMIIFISSSSKLDITQKNNIIYFSGQLFFASTKTFIDFFENSDLEDELVIDFSRVHIWDDSGVEALNKVFDKLEKDTKSFLVKGLHTKNNFLEKRIQLINKNYYN